MSIELKSHVAVCLWAYEGNGGGKGVENWMEISLHWETPLKPCKKTDRPKGRKIEGI